VGSRIGALSPDDAQLPVELWVEELEPMWVQGPVIFAGLFVADDGLFEELFVDVEVAESVNRAWLTALRLVCAPAFAAAWLTVATW
jgi:hypothetical protein